MVKMVNFVLCVFYHKKKKKGMENTGAAILISERADSSEGSYQDKEAPHTMIRQSFLYEDITILNVN